MCMCLSFEAKLYLFNKYVKSHSMNVNKHISKNAGGLAIKCLNK